VRVGVCILPDARWADARERWVTAEALGFEHAWTYDHLTWRSFRDEPWFGSVPTLTAAAEATSRIRLGPLVASPNFRHPVPFAKELATLDDVSGGRLEVGLGAGGVGWDATALGQDEWPRKERTERFEEVVELLDLLLSQPATTWQGRWYAAAEARMLPTSLQVPRIPFALAATGPRGLRLAARFARTWITVGPVQPGDAETLSLDAAAGEVRRQGDALDAACAEAGRDPGELRRLALVGLLLPPVGVPGADQWDDAVGRYAEAGITDLVVHWPRAEGIYAGDRDAFERLFGR
jgi:alkanesulfonate monooxygenase SsuD/methylene tetrahydromethanopterin reductase-like flavin-dependent oxidoreductase (luciferase family)